MSSEFLLMLVGLGLIGGFASGLLGMGGAIIIIPLLLFVPDYFGFESFSLNTITGISMVQSLVGTFSAFLVHRKKKFVHMGLVKWMGIPILAASFIGAIISKFLPEQYIFLLFAFLTLQAAFMMFMPKNMEQNVDLEDVVFNKRLASVIAFTLGIMTGILGVGGAFLFVPIMIYVLKIPIRITLGTSVTVAFLASFTGVIGKLGTDQIPISIAIVIALAAFLGANVGAKISPHVPTRVLQVLVGLFIAGIALRTWFDLSDFLATIVVIKLFLISTAIAVSFFVYYTKKFYRSYSLNNPD